MSSDGLSGFPPLPEADLDGRLRVDDGDGDGTAAVDMGAYEFQRQSHGQQRYSPNG